MAKVFGPATPTAFVPELTVSVVEFVGKSQPIRTLCAPRGEVPNQAKMRAMGKKTLTRRKLAQSLAFDSDDRPEADQIKWFPPLKSGSDQEKSRERLDPTSKGRPTSKSANCGF